MKTFVDPKDAPRIYQDVETMIRSGCESEYGDLEVVRVFKDEESGAMVVVAEGGRRYAIELWEVR